MLHVNPLSVFETFGLILPISILIIAYCYPCFIFRSSLFEYGLILVIPAASDVLCCLLSRSCLVSELTCCGFLRTRSTQVAICNHSWSRLLIQKRQGCDADRPNSSWRNDSCFLLLVRTTIIPGRETVASIRPLQTSRRGDPKRIEYKNLFFFSDWFVVFWHKAIYWILVRDMEVTLLIITRGLRPDFCAAEWRIIQLETGI